MKTISNREVDQQQLWNFQHAQRGTEGPEGTELCNIPNDSAIEFIHQLKDKSVILEVGSANGRDARFWAMEGHRVYALDFSQVALDQLNKLAIIQNVQSLIIPLLWNIADGQLPLSQLKDKIDGFYARSALHVGDNEMIQIAEQLNTVLKPGGRILIEGKGPNDKKIKRSQMVDRNLAIDVEEDGHLRRVWTEEFIGQLCGIVGWDIVSISKNTENWSGTNASFVRLSAQKR